LTDHKNELCTESRWHVVHSDITF